MAYDEDIAARVRKILSKQRGVTEKVMMGSLAFMVTGTMCCSVGKDGLLARIAAEHRDEILEDPNVEPMRMGGRTMRGFVRVKREGFRTDSSLAQWIERGIQAGIAQRRDSRRRRR